MAFCVMVSTQCITTMVPVAACAGVGECLVLVFIVTDGTVAAFGFGEVRRVAAEATVGVG
jgi:hypothetical protein